jgi:hypothetical protein
MPLEAYQANGLELRRFFVGLGLIFFSHLLNLNAFSNFLI